MPGNQTHPLVSWFHDPARQRLQSSSSTGDQSFSVSSQALGPSSTRPFRPLATWSSHTAPDPGVPSVKAGHSEQGLLAGQGSTRSPVPS